MDDFHVYASSFFLSSTHFGDSVLTYTDTALNWLFYPFSARLADDLTGEIHSGVQVFSHFRPGCSKQNSRLPVRGKSAVDSRAERKFNPPFMKEDAHRHWNE